MLVTPRSSEADQRTSWLLPMHQLSPPTGLVTDTVGGVAGPAPPELSSCVAAAQTMQGKRRRIINAIAFGILVPSSLGRIFGFSWHLLTSRVPPSSDSVPAEIQHHGTSREVSFGMQWLHAQKGKTALLTAGSSKNAPRFSINLRAVSRTRCRLLPVHPRHRRRSPPRRRWDRS